MHNEELYSGSLAEQIDFIISEVFSKAKEQAFTEASQRIAEIAPGINVIKHHRDMECPSSFEQLGFTVTTYSIPVLVIEHDGKVMRQRFQEK